MHELETVMAARMLVCLLATGTVYVALNTIQRIDVRTG